MQIEMCILKTMSHILLNTPVSLHDSTHCEKYSDASPVNTAFYPYIHYPNAKDIYLDLRAKIGGSSS